MLITLFEIAKTIIISTPLVFLATILYVNLLLGIANVFGGGLKFILSMCTYALYNVVIVAPFLVLLWDVREAIAVTHAYWQIVIAFISYFAVMYPSFKYLFKTKIESLQRAGYFKQ